MNSRNILPLAALILTASLGQSAFSASVFAEEGPSVSEEPSAPAPAAPTSEESPGKPSERLDQKEIFEILQGGASLSDPGLLDHLWHLAGSLSGRDWSPPEVTVRVVVASTAPTVP